MQDPIMLEKLQALLKHKKSKTFYAERLGVSVAEVEELLDELKRLDEGVGPYWDQEDIPTEIVHDFDKGTIEFKGSCTEEIKDLPSFLKQGNVDTETYQVSRFWQMYRNGKWRFSVCLRPKSQEDYSPEELISRISEILNKPTKVLPLPRAVTSNDKSLVLYVADEHVAAAQLDTALYENEYNASVYKERKETILSHLLKEVATHGAFDKIIVISLGDNLDGYNGQTTRGGHSLPQNMSNREAFDTYLEVNKSFWDTLLTSSMANTYEFRCQTNDNHSGGYGYAASKAVELYLNTKYPQVTTSLYSKFIDHFKLGVHTLMVCHGKDQVNRRQNLPLHLDSKTTVFIKDYMDYYKIPADLGRVHFIKADLHLEACEFGKGFRYRNVLSLFGSSSWIMDNFGYTNPGFSYDIYENNSNQVWESRVLL